MLGQWCLNWQQHMFSHACQCDFRLNRGPFEKSPCNCVNGSMMPTCMRNLFDIPWTPQYYCNIISILCPVNTNSMTVTSPPDSLCIACIKCFWALGGSTWWMILLWRQWFPWLHDLTVALQVLSHNLCTVMKIPHDPVALEQHFKDDDEGPVSNQGYMPYLNRFILDKVSSKSTDLFVLFPTTLLIVMPSGSAV